MTSVVVAEVTQPSLGVGYELGRAVDMKKKIFCLFRPSSGRSECTSCFLIDTLQPGWLLRADFLFLCSPVGHDPRSRRRRELCGARLQRGRGGEGSGRVLQQPEKLKAAVPDVHRLPK